VKVDFEEMIDLLFGSFLHRAQQPVARVVDYDIEPAVQSVSLLDRGAYRGQVGYLQRQDPDIPRVPLEGGFTVTGSPMTMSLLASACSVNTLPKPRDTPVMNQTF
jgi:hypothetical protein